MSNLPLQVVGKKLLKERKVSVASGLVENAVLLSLEELFTVDETNPFRDFSAQMAVTKKYVTQSGDISYVDEIVEDFCGF